MSRFQIAAALVALAACSKAEPTTIGPGSDSKGVAPPPPEVSVELAGVTLADDCPDGRATKPTPPPPSLNTRAAAGSAAAAAAAEPARESMQAKMGPPSAGGCVDPSNCHGPSSPPCEQSSMQLAIRAPADVEGTRLAIKKVELLDEAGKVVGELAARTPTRWDGSSTYVAWDEQVTAGQSVVASYKLAAPDWTTIANGRWNAQAKRFKLRVTVTVGNKDRRVEKRSITPAMPEPEVAT